MRPGVFRLAIAPEGTRSRTEFWKSGFYHLARAANVPLALGYIDYPAREVGVGGYVDVTGDPAADMARLRAFYGDKRGRYPAESVSRSPARRIGARGLTSEDRGGKRRRGPARDDCRRARHGRQ